jgi:hypothetical protein
MDKIIRTLIFSNTAKRIVFVTSILILFGIFVNHSSFKPMNEHLKPRGVIVTLIRSDNRSILLVINMIHSITMFHPVDNTSRHSFLIFHDQNFTSSMQQHILSCVLKSNKQVHISFALADFRTNAQVDIKTRKDKPIGYRLMCRFWSYDVFYHPAIVQGRYDYLMRMDDDSYFSDIIKKDLFVYMNSKKLDYIYRALYIEPIKPMIPILQRFLNKTTIRLGCIYNNFFIIRLKWFYESKRVQKFLEELIRDNLMLREYIGDGCIHGAMLEIDNRVKYEHVTDVSYGHNAHLMPSGEAEWMFDPVKGFNEELKKSCQQLTVIRSDEDKLIKINMSSSIKTF